MKKILAIVAVSAAILVTLSCNKMESAAHVEESENPPQNVTTRAPGDKTPATICYIETNDTNPLNAGDYYLGTYTFFDYVVLFASNIHKESVGGEVRPTLYLNDKLTPVLEGGVSTYVTPLQNKGIKVLLGVLGDWVELGLSNMTATQAEQFATILAYAVNKYGLNGVSFDDEYSGTSSIVSGSYSTIITKYRELRPDDIIHVFDWGGTSYISSTAASCVNFADHGYFGSWRANTTSNITGMTAARWSPMSFNLGSSNSTSTIQTYASNAVSNNYGYMMFFNLRRYGDYNCLTQLQAAATGAGWGTVTRSGGNRTRNAGSVSGGYTINYATATSNN